MSVVTQSAYEPAAEAFVGFCGTERQKRELRRLQLLELHNLQQPGFLERNSGGDERARQATSPTTSPPLPSDLPAVVATCDCEDADAVKLQRCIASIDVSSENGRFRLAGEILAACSKIVRVPVANVVLHYGYECACHRTAALDSDMSPGQQLWFPKIANKPIVQLLLDMAQSSEVDETRAIICSSLERIAFFESGRFIAASEAIVPVLLHMAHRVPARARCCRPSKNISCVHLWRENSKRPGSFRLIRKRNLAVGLPTLGTSFCRLQATDVPHTC